MVQPGGRKEGGQGATCGVGAPAGDTDPGPVVPGGVCAMQEQGRRGGRVRACGPT
jgi:hypothetical protein